MNLLHRRSLFFLVAFLAFGYIVARLVRYDGWNTSRDFVSDDWALLLLVQIVLWGSNILLESIRWKKLIRPVSGETNIISALKMVLMGFTTGSITPGKVGEPGGKVLHLKNEERVTGVMASFYGSFLNSVVLLIIAVIVMPMVVSKGIIKLPDELTGSALFYAVTGVVTVAAGFGALYILFVRFKKKVRNTRWAVKESFFVNFKAGNVLILFFLTLLRVLIYNFQLYVWFMFFSLNDPVILLLSPLYFAFITLFPTFFLVDLGIRGSVGMFIFGSLVHNVPVLLSVIFFLWLINVALPSFAGGLIIMRHNE